MAEETLTAIDDDVESKIKSAMNSRVSYFNSQSDSLTLEGVRRLLEKDLGMPEFSLDSYKSFVKQFLTDCMNRSDGEVKEEPTSAATKSKNPNAEGEKMDDSPVMGLLQNEPIQKATETENIESEFPNEEDVKKALWDRASYIKANSESVTMAGLRRLLEEDLSIKKFSLDSFKKIISSELDEILKSSKTPENKAKKSSKGKPTSKKKPSEEEKPGKRKNTVKETNPKKKTKTGTNSNDSQSNSSAEIPKTKKEVSLTPTYGKRVEHLKSVIKSCGLNVSPAIYKKLKKLSEAQREAQLVKELEAILSKEGLSSNPSEKEIKEVKRRKERAKDLEGIDTSNIVSSSRRRGSYVPIKDIYSSESESDDFEDDDNDNNDDNDKNNTRVEDEIGENNDSENNEEDSQSSDDDSKDIKKEDDDNQTENGSNEENANDDDKKDEDSE